MDRQPRLEGERIYLRPMTGADRDALYQIAGDPLLWEQHPFQDRWKPEPFGAFFDDGLAAGGALVAVERGTGRVIGSSQYRPNALDPQAIEIGWTYLSRSLWGSGVNAEMKRLMLAHALASVPRVLFRVGEANWRSRKAMEKIGGSLTDLVEEAEHGGQILRHVVFEITQDSFASGPLNRRD